MNLIIAILTVWVESYMADVTYDAYVDAVYILFRPGPQVRHTKEGVYILSRPQVHHTKEIECSYEAMVLVDYDIHNQPIGVEIIGAGEIWPASVWASLSVRDLVELA